MDHSPWHLRFPTFKDEQRYQNLIVLNDLTRTWSSSASLELESLLRQNLSTHLETPQARAQQAPEFLDDVEKKIWATHLKVLKQQEHHSSLSELSWAHGQKIAVKRWTSFFPLKNSWSLDQLWMAQQNFPLTQSAHGPLYLIKRATPLEIILALQQCPHQNRWVPPEHANPLCLLHNHWTRGFLQALNPNVQLEPILESPTCLQRWFL